MVITFMSPSRLKTFIQKQTNEYCIHVSLCHCNPSLIWIKSAGKRYKPKLHISFSIAKVVHLLLLHGYNIFTYTEY